MLEYYISFFVRNGWVVVPSGFNCLLFAVLDTLDDLLLDYETSYIDSDNSYSVYRPRL